jgi:hypothetical protein
MNPGARPSDQSTRSPARPAPVEGVRGEREFGHQTVRPLGGNCAHRLRLSASQFSLGLCLWSASASEISLDLRGRICHFTYVSEATFLMVLVSQNRNFVDFVFRGVAGGGGATHEQERCRKK